MDTVNCIKENCLSFNVEIFRHIFKNNTHHAKAVCNECGYRWHVNHKILTDTTPLYKPNEIKQIKKTIRQKRTILIPLPKPPPLPKPIIEAVKKLEAIKSETKTCKLCENLFTAFNNSKIHSQGICSKRCKRKKRRKYKVKKIKISKDFYSSREWMEARYKKIKEYGRKCMCCGAVNVEIHVDHIKPISKYPELALDLDNLQILCKLCNFGKSNKDETDWRPSVPQTQES